MKRLRWYDFISINLFWLGLNIRNTAVGSVFMPYLVDMFVNPEVKNTYLGIMRTAGLVIAMLVQPAMGLLSDHSTSRFGRRRPFIFIGVIFDLIFMVGIGLSGNYWALFVVLLFQQFSANVSHGPLQGLIPDLVPEEQRGRASAVKAIFELIPLVLVAFTIGKLVSQKQVWPAIWVTCAAVFLTMLLTMLLVKEEPLKEKPTTSLREPMLRVMGVLVGVLFGGVIGLIIGGGLGTTIICSKSFPECNSIVRVLGGGGAKEALASFAKLIQTYNTANFLGISLGGMLAMAIAVIVGVWAGAYATLGQDARRQSPFTWWIVNRLMFLAAVTSIQSFAPYFLMSAFQLTREAAIGLNTNLMMVVGLFTMVTALPGGWLADKFGKKVLTAVAGLVAVIGTLILLSTTLVPNLTVMYVAGITIGLAAGLFMTTNWALGTELAPKEEAGRYLGISNLAGAGAGMVGAGIGGPVADLINRLRPGLGYFVIFSCYVALFALSIVSLIWVKKRA